ncbi:hypothetical protein BO71DRAFT_385640 [Aspergillus ellipticus CBS 707.79]|uniref:Pre-rRNA-processing protein ESF2 n=1 Tax=Aspergillus ellipticus CBS 707.79 TaxID=1448320 RepID=A0A319D1R3_9EURO|nr:hypothetical protein BO71DRAFT_385640 [Aspergillus ellipticus CBS 707.79]
MSTKQASDFLDLAGSDVSDNDAGSDRGYDSEAAEQQKSKGRSTTSLKRRRTEDLHGLNDDSDSDSDNEHNSDEEEATTKGKGSSSRAKRSKLSTPPSDDDDGASNAEPTTTSKPKSSKPKALKPKTKKNKTGVIYLSSLPPYLKPMSLKALIEKRSFTGIKRVFLSPTVRPTSGPARRSNKRKTYSDGWVEFESKKMAKLCAETLNASIVGGPKGGWYHDDVWNMKYLRGFKWADLQETVARERNEREARQRMEDTKARKEDKVFLEGYERGKVIEGIQEKRRQKQAQKGGDEGESGEKKVQVQQKPRMVFKQSEVKMGRDKVADPGKMGDETQRVLGKIF